MRLKEFLEQTFLKSILFEMSMSRREAHDRCIGLYPQIGAHALEILLMKQNSLIPHWQEELNAFIGKLNDITLKPKFKRLDIESYINWLFIEPGKSFYENILKDILLKYKKEKPKIYPKLYEDYSYFMNELCSDLANGNYDKSKLDNYLGI